MHTTYTIAEACKALSVSPRTLHGWMKKAGVQPEQSPIDYREHVLSAQTVKHLATLHGVTIGNESQVKASEPASRAVKQLKAEVAALESRVSELQSQIETLSSEFREFMDDISSRLAAPAPKILRPPSAEYTPSDTSVVPADVPSNAMDYQVFADHHGVNRRTFRDHISRGWTPAIELGKPNRPREKMRYLTREQQAQALAFWTRNGTRFEQCDDPHCPCHA